MIRTVLATLFAVAAIAAFARWHFVTAIVLAFVACCLIADVADFGQSEDL
jgi:hypothetical protein